MPIKEQSIVVTGAAQGIVECVAKTLSAAGAELLLADIQEEKVANVAAASDNGWIRLAVEPKPDHDVREELFKLTKSKGWSLREIRREVATLEDFFIKVTAEQKQQRSFSAAKLSPINQAAINITP